MNENNDFPINGKFSINKTEKSSEFSQSLSNKRYKSPPNIQKSNKKLTENSSNICIAFKNNFFLKKLNGSQLLITPLQIKFLRKT